MAIFHEFDNRGRDRSVEDRRRHRELVEESIKKNIGDIIAEESIIGKSKDKKIKIPIKSIKEYQFIYGKNSKGTGSGDGSEKRGDKIGQGQKEHKGQGGVGQPGNQEGEDIYETEITIDELVRYLFDDLMLPDLEKKKLADIESDRSIKNAGYQRKGIPPRLAKKRSVIEKIKRKQAYNRFQQEEELQEPQEDGSEASRRFPFIEDDLRYRRVKQDYKKEFNAVVICIMDVSGSMDRTKKYLARSFYFLLYQFLRLKYTNVEIVFVAHTTTAREVNEDEFFHRGESGGTYISSGYEKALEIIEQRYNPSTWNIYAFHCSDGDNWNEDNPKAVALAKELCKVCNLFGYGEILSYSYASDSAMKNQYRKHIEEKNFCIVSIDKKEDVFPALKRMLEKEGEPLGD